MKLLLVMPMLLVAAMTFAQSAAPRIKRTNPPTLSKPTGYTHVVEVTGGTTVYIAGQVPLDKDGNLVGAGDMQAQAEQVFKNLESALAVAGGTFADVVKMNTYTTDITKVAAIRDVRARYFGDTTPASTLVQVAQLFRPDVLLEIEVVAVVK